MMKRSHPACATPLRFPLAPKVTNAAVFPACITSTAYREGKCTTREVLALPDDEECRQQTFVAIAAGTTPCGRTWRPILSSAGVSLSCGHVSSPISCSDRLHLKDIGAFPAFTLQHRHSKRVSLSYHALAMYCRHIGGKDR